MKLSPLEAQVVATMHGLPLDKQQFILDFSRFIRSTALTGTENPQGKRRAGLGKGNILISADFDEPLPDEFWLGDEQG